MVPEKIDEIFKDTFRNSDKLPKNLQWQKEDAWNALKRNQKIRKIRTVIFSGAAAVFFVFLFLFISHIRIEPKISDKYYDDMIEYQKRQKLKEIEMSMSGKTFYREYCMTCDGLLPKPYKDLNPVFYSF